MGLKNIQDREVFDKAEKHLYLLKDDFTPRLSFGAYYGSLKGNASEYCVTFFQEKFISYINYTSKYILNFIYF